MLNQSNADADNQSNEKVGVLLINLGTPSATSYWPVRAYLKEFLSDPRVIEANRFVWWFILNVVILTIRPKKSGHAYEQIWNKELNESPLKTFTRAQSEKLVASLSANKSILVDWAMRYEKPDIESKLVGLKNDGCEKILIFPLYPQYSATTTASIFDKIGDAMRKLRWQPTLRFVPPFFNKSSYINALAIQTNDHLKSLKWAPEKIIISYHGLPQEYIDKGDPYYDHCIATSTALIKKMGLDSEMVETTFQSRLGPKQWLTPYTDETVVAAAKSGIKNIMLISPAFISDCVETLEELSIGVAEEFIEAGGENFSVAPCLNDSNVAIDMLAEITRNELKGWL